MQRSLGRRLAAEPFCSRFGEPGVTKTLRVQDSGGGFARSRRDLSVPMVGGQAYPSRFLFWANNCTTAWLKDSRTPQLMEGKIKKYPQVGSHEDLVWEPVLSCEELLLARVHWHHQEIPGMYV